VGQPVGAVVAEAAVAVRSPAEQAMQRRGARPRQPVAQRRVDRQARGLVVHRLLEPGRRLAGRRGQRHQWLRPPGGGRLLAQQRDDARDGGRPAGARAPGDHAESPQHSVQAPADTAARDPVLDARQVVVVEAKAPADRLAVGEVEDLRGGHTAAGELQEPGDDAEHGVGLTQRAVGQAHPQVGRAQRCRQFLLVLLVDDLPRAERGVDERRERLDVGAITTM